MKIFLTLLALFAVGFGLGCSSCEPSDPTPEPAQPEDISVANNTEIPEPMIQVPMSAVETAHTIAHHKTQVAQSRMLIILGEVLFDAHHPSHESETRSVLYMLSNTLRSFRMEIAHDFYFATGQTMERCRELHRGFAEMHDILRDRKFKDPNGVPDDLISYLRQYTEGLKEMADATEAALAKEKTE